MHTIPQLHDATLKSIHFSWAEGTVLLELLLPGSVEATLVFSQVTGFNAPRAFEWGPSKSINEFREKSQGAFEIEMQSGDAIQICASACELRP